MKLEATHLRGSWYAVRPEGALGTHGFINNEGWEVEYVNARSPEEAIRKVLRLRALRATNVLGRPHIAVDQDTGELLFPEHR